MITVAGGDEEVVGKGGAGADRGGAEEVEGVVVEVEVAFHELVGGEVGGVGWEAAGNDGLRAFPEASETTVSEEGGSCF